MKKGNAITFAVGVFAGLALCGPAAQAADYLTAKPSTQPIYVDGQRVSMTAYSISGNNYVKLRDIGKAVDFGVTYDASTNSVHLNPNAHYQEEVKPSAPTQTTPSALTEERVSSIIWGLLDEYPVGAYYGPFYRSYSNGPYGMAPTNCAGWATLCSDAAFGDLPWRRIANPRWDQIRAGDLIEYDNEYGGHVVVVLDKTDEFIITTESGLNNEARWGGQYFKWWLEGKSGYGCYTRYPE